MKINESPLTESKYSKDIEELEQLKKRVQKIKIKPNKYNDSGYFLRILLTLTLLITFFAVGFSIALRKQNESVKEEFVNYIPEAEIILPTITE